ncbi:MAG: ammonia-forming cytochrome c nitrite reductase subunit c552 [Thermoguttaceae bacterium]
MTTSPQSSPDAPRPVATWAWLGWLLLVAAAGATFGLGILAASILHRREEAAQKVPLRPIDEMEMDAARWGENYPREYDSYKRMQDSSPATKTKYGGAAKRDYLEEGPATVILFAGSTFDKDYRQARGHAHTIDDVTGTLRVKVENADHQLVLNPEKPATCWTCKSPDVPRLMKKMGGLENGGPAKFYASKFADLKDEITHPIGCYDCHEANTMKLHITRPALLEALKRRDPSFDIDQVSHQEMRSLVCAQCHVEYYFRGKGNYLTFPWDKGTTPERIEEYFDETDFADFTNPVSKTRNLKIRHPDFELYSTGVHAYRNVACADCHMPYRTEGGVKFTDHHLQSPLHNVSNSCAVCHRWSEQEIRARVESIQDKVRETRSRAEDALAKAHLDVAAAMEAGAKDDELAAARKQIRHAQLKWDYIAASNGMGFHSPAEALRILAGAVDQAEQARLDCARILARHGCMQPIVYPDFSTKERAQTLVKQFAAGRPPKLLPEREKTALK